jgi:hypothetical protein
LIKNLSLLLHNPNHYKPMIYKIYPAVLLFIFFLLQQLIFFWDKNLNETEISVIKASSETKEETVYNNLNANKFALPKLECFTEALKGFLKKKGLISKTYWRWLILVCHLTQKTLGIDLTTYNFIQLSSRSRRNNTERVCNQFFKYSPIFKSSLGFMQRWNLYWENTESH